MNVSIIPVTALEQNCSLLCCESSGKGAVVDPGGEPERILAAAREAGVEIEKIHAKNGGVIGMRVYRKSLSNYQL